MPSYYTASISRYQILGTEARFWFDRYLFDQAALIFHFGLKQTSLYLQM